VPGGVFEMKDYFLSIMKGQRKGFLAQLIIYLLLPCSWIYRIGVFCHRNYYRLSGSFKAPKPVISIGNITVGGSGKTPLVIWLARNLQNKGLKSIILIRGYMPKASKVSDEVDMLNEQIPYIPVIAGADRAANIREAESILPVDLYICDDAFQHWPLYRDLNIVTIDAVNPFGNGFLLPAGILREPLSSLKRADVFILTKIEDPGDTRLLTSRLKKINPKALIMESRYKSAGVVNVFDVKPVPEDFLKDRPVAGFCAIGDPLSFGSSLRNSGAVIVKLFAFMDHHVYKKEDIQKLLGFCELNKIQVLVTTHKDTVKLRNFKEQFSGITLVYLPIQLEITKGADEFFQKVISICNY
jgi:tetraacyldisaccharide 4'-kinase